MILAIEKSGSCRRIVQACSCLKALLLVILVASTSHGSYEENKPVIFSDSQFEKEQRIVYGLLKAEIKDAERFPGSEKVVIKIALIDLNQDGRNEILAYIKQRQYFCGQLGCPFMVLIATPRGRWKNILDDLSVVQEADIALSDHRTNGFQDIVFGGDAIWKWNGKKYAFAERTRAAESKNMDHAPFREIPQDASLDDLKFVPFPSQLKKYEVYPWELLELPEFETLYRAILGPEIKTNWIRNLSGPANKAQLLRTSQTEYVFAQSCRPHACNTEGILIIFDFQSNKCWAKLTEDGIVTWLGKPSVEVKAIFEMIEKGKVTR